MSTMGSSKRRLECLKLSAAMKRRLTKDDPIPTADELITYAKELDSFAFNGRTVLEQEAYEKAQKDMRR